MCFGREIHNLRDYKHLQFLGRDYLDRLLAMQRRPYAQ